MPNRYLDTTLVDKAIKFAVDAHANTERRGKGFPYCIHVLEAMSIVATITNDPELLAAAALHDTVEDTDVTIDTIRAEFSDRIADLVDAESDKGDTFDGNDWRARKQHAIDRLAAASRDAKIVAIGDKLSNMRAIARDYARQGDGLWDLFHAPGGKADHEWHYRQLQKSLSELSGTEAYAEFSALIEEVFGKIRPELINMDDYVESGDGFTAISYNSKDGRTVIKLYSNFIPSSQPENELKVSWKLAELGLNIPEAYRLVTDGKRVGLEFERITGKRSFARAISQEPERIEEYSRQFARFCKKLHQTPCDTKLFPHASERFLKSLKVAEGYTEEQKARIARFILDIPDANTCVHGDMHIGNALMADGKEYWIDLADFAYGNPLFDFGMFYFTCFAMDEDTAGRLYHMPLSKLQECWDYFLDEYFGSDADKEKINDSIKPYAALYMMHFSTRRAISPFMQQFIRDYLL